MTNETITNPIGNDLIMRWTLDHHYRESRVCPSCAQDCRSTALIHLAYVFRACDCGDPTYGHLVEQLWHLACLQERRPELDRAAQLAVDVLRGGHIPGLNRNVVADDLARALIERSA